MKPNRKAKALYERAAVVTYVRCPITQRLIVRPAGSTLLPQLTVDVN